MKRRKLQLRAETLRTLTAEQLAGVQGGVVTGPDPTFVYSCDNPWSCGYSTITVCTNRPATA